MLIKADNARETLPAWIEAHYDELQQALVEHGGILFRGYPVASAAAFQDCIRSFRDHGLDYMYRSTPRTRIARGVFTATEYPARLEIPLHNENAYQREWPLRVAFCCLQPSIEGGETPLADMRSVTRALPDTVVDAFERRGVRYIRHYHPDVDLSWQEVFQSHSQVEVSRFCEARGIECEWLDGLLRTMQSSQGTAIHPTTGERLFFNQAHLFHASSLGNDVAQAMVDAFGEDRLPRDACHADGNDFAIGALDTVREALRRESITFRWQSGDVLLLDNMQIAHGRRPYRGERTILTAMMTPHRGA